MHLNSKLKWSANTDVQLQLGFYQTVVASVLFCAAVCWRTSLTGRNNRRLDKLAKKIGSVLRTTVKAQTGFELLAILHDAKHLLQHTLMGQSSPALGGPLSQQPLDCSVTY